METDTKKTITHRGEEFTLWRTELQGYYSTIHINYKGDYLGSISVESDFLNSITSLRFPYEFGYSEDRDQRLQYRYDTIEEAIKEECDFILDNYDGVIERQDRDKQRFDRAVSVMDTYFDSI